MTAPGAEASRLPASGDVEYSTRDFERIAEILNGIAGIHMPGSNEALVFSRLAKRVRGRGFSRFSDYVAHIASGQDPAERDAMVAALTTNTTRFFREDYHFETFARDVLPGLRDRATGGGRVRLWSAGCSSGEEPYSLASVVLRHFPEVARHDVRILATDINREVLATAEEGIYPASAAGGVPSVHAQLLFDPGARPETVSVRNEARDLISFRYMNFMEPWPVRGPFGAIFCRNVMIYMQESTQARIWAALTNLLEPGGYLFIGHSERIGPELRDQLELVGKTTFRRV